MNWARTLRRLYAVLAGQFGVDLLRSARAIATVPRFAADFIRFRRSHRGTVLLYPCLHDRNAEAGAVGSEYLWQDLYVAQLIHEANPRKHVDVGSRLDGFVAHVASFREIEVLDIRPLRKKIPRVLFRQTDITNLPEDMEEYCDSVSCLHALEHIGLGRYGDRIDPEGWRLGLANLARLLQPGGTLYLSVPVGIERVEFNAHRVFDPRQISSVAADRSLRLVGLTVIRDDGRVETFAVDDAQRLDEQLSEIALQWYCLAIFHFMRWAEHAPRG